MEQLNDYMRFSVQKRSWLGQIVCECGEFAWGLDDMFVCPCGKKYRAIEHWMAQGRIDLYVKGVASKEELEERIEPWSKDKRCVDKKYCQFCTKRGGCYIYEPVQKKGKKLRFDAEKYLRTTCNFSLIGISSKHVLPLLTLYKNESGPVSFLEDSILSAESASCIQGGGYPSKYWVKPNND